MKTKILLAGCLGGYLWVAAVLYAREVRARKIAARATGGAS
jgi:hypothetical protein